MEDVRYDAFISYRHSEADMYVAKKIHKMLETFKVPRSVKNKYGKKSIHRVFRDQEELPIGSDLADNIVKALSESEYLIVICSPRTPESYWVQKEIDTFIAMHGRTNILAVLIEGEPSESFPKQLLTDEKGEPVEPLAADVRGAVRRETDKKLKTEIVRLAAPLLHCSYDELRQRHRERKIRKAFYGLSGFAVLAAAFGGYSAYNAVMIQKNYEGKQINQSKYLADTAMNLIEEGDRITAGLIAMEALPGKKDDRPYVTSASYALGQALNLYDNGNVIQKDCLLKHDMPVSNISYSYDGTELVSIDTEGNVYVWDIESRKEIIKIAARINDNGNVVNTLNAGVTKDNHLIIANSDKIYGLDLEGNELWSVEPDAEYIQCELDLELGIAAGISRNSVDFIDIKDGSSAGKMENTSETSVFSSEGVFDTEHKQFAVSCYATQKDAENGGISVYDFAKSEKMDYVTKGSYILEIVFCENGNPAVLSQTLQDNQSAKNEAYLEKFDCVSKACVWTNTVQINLWELSETSAILKYRSYSEEGTQNVHNEVLLSVHNMAYTWDSAAGGLISATGVSSEIAAFLVSSQTNLGYVVEKDGILNMIDMTAGKNYSNAKVDIGRQVRDVIVDNGVLAARLSYSPDVMLMKYHEGYGMETLQELDDSISAMNYSTNETYYSLSMGDTGTESAYYFYKTEDNSSVNQWSTDGDIRPLVSEFVNDSVYAIVERSGNLVFYNVENGEENVLNPKESYIGTGYCISQNKKYAFVYGGSAYYVADLQKQEIIAEGTLEEQIKCGIISEDGKTAYGSITDMSLISLDTKTGALKHFDMDGYKIAFVYGDTPFAINPDGSLLAVSCVDNQLRILDTKEMKITDEIEFAGHNRLFIGFADNRKIIMQGDTFYYRVYDVKKHKFLFVSKEQNNMIQDMIIDNQAKTICLITTSEMLILNQKDFEPLACIENGLTYMPKHGYVFNKYINTLYRYPYMDLDMMLKEAEKVFGDNGLTERERTQYNVD